MKPIELSSKDLKNSKEYIAKLPKYDHLLFQTFSLDVWDPDDYPIVILDEVSVNRVKRLLPVHSKMFRYSQTFTYRPNLWYTIYKCALIIEKFVFDENTTFELKFNENLIFSLTTENKEFHFGNFPLFPLTFCTIRFRLAKIMKIKVVYNDVVHIKDLEKTREYLDDRLFQVGDELLVSRYGTCEKYFPEDYVGKVKPLMDPNQRKMVSYLAMLFFEEVGVNPEFIVAESSFLM